MNEEEEGMKEVGMETKDGKGEKGASKVSFFLLSFLFTDIKWVLRKQLLNE